MVTFSENQWPENREISDPQLTSQQGTNSVVIVTKTRHVVLVE
jgi:hypothetical protein